MTRDPAFGLPAVWIDAGQRENAQAMGRAAGRSMTGAPVAWSELPSWGAAFSSPIRAAASAIARRTNWLRQR